ncbi:translocon-associated protein subunit alpha [Marisediminicola senii]|uniref:hypothetical protein n=1 Tax=Marisediminicola senii TaxID=2711233 RepID=UPI0013ED4A15|nr:hypothetical protein [Marisediminicola senii]
MSTQTDPARLAAVDAGETLLTLLRTHVDRVAAGTDDGDDAEEVDRDLWDAIAAYGDALDELYEGEEDGDETATRSEPDELTFTVRARYDYTVVDEKAFLAAGAGLGGAIEELLSRAGGRPLPAFEVDALETGSGLLTVHLNGELLASDDFADAEEPTDLLLVDPEESLQFVLDEPLYGSRAEAEAAAKRHAE